MERESREKQKGGAEGQEAEYGMITRRRLLFGGAAVIAASAIGAILLSRDDEVETEMVPKLEDPKRTVPEKREIAGLPRNNFTKVRPVTLPTTGRELDKLIALQEHWKAITEEALDKFVDADPMVLLLINFMQERAYYSLPQGPVVTRAIFTEGDSQSVMERMKIGLSYSNKVRTFVERSTSIQYSPVLTIFGISNVVGGSGCCTGVT